MRDSIVPIVGVQKLTMGEVMNANIGPFIQAIALLGAIEERMRHESQEELDRFNFIHNLGYDLGEFTVEYIANGDTGKITIFTQLVMEKTAEFRHILNNTRME